MIIALLQKFIKAYPSIDGISLIGMNLVDCRNTDVYNSQLVIKIKRKNDNTFTCYYLIGCVMIQDKTKLQEYQEEWKGVRGFQAKIQRHLNAASIGVGGFASHELRNISHNLVLLFAFSVLEKVLEQLLYEGKIIITGKPQHKRPPLKKIMEASKSDKSAIKWLDYDKVDEARNKRNGIAHRQKLIERGKCWEYIDAIESELVRWQILSAPIPFKH